MPSARLDRGQKLVAVRHKTEFIKDLLLGRLSIVGFAHALAFAYRSGGGGACPGK